MSTAAESRPSVQPRLRARALVILSAVAAGLAVWAVAVPIVGADLTVGAAAEPQHVGPLAVILVSLLAGLAGTGLVTLLERATRRPRTAWLIASLAVLLLSLAGPLGAASVAATVALAGMHLAVGLSIAVGLARTLP
ncbi:MAG: DUF6069 family protein [Streptosporangiales bacterium]